MILLVFPLSHFASMNIPGTWLLIVIGVTSAVKSCGGSFLGWVFSSTMEDLLAGKGKMLLSSWVRLSSVNSSRFSCVNCESESDVARPSQVDATNTVVRISLLMHV